MFSRFALNEDEQRDGIYVGTATTIVYGADTEFIYGHLRMELPLDGSTLPARTEIG